MSRSKVPQPQAIYMMTCGYFVFSVSVVPLGSLYVPMGRSTLTPSVFRCRFEVKRLENKAFY